MESWAEKHGTKEEKDMARQYLETKKKIAELKKETSNAVA